MKNYCKIIRSHIAPQVQMGDIQLRQAFPLSNLEQISPFILLHHFDVTNGLLVKKCKIFGEKS